jgi:hypothetical protein
MNRLLLFIALAASMIACSSSRGRLKMGQLNASLAQLTGLEGDPLDKTPVEFEQTGKPEYDEFFVESAKVQAGLVVSNALTEAMTKNIKGYAISFVASNANNDNVKQLLGGRAANQLSVDESLAALKLKKQQGKLSDDETKFAVSSAVNAVQVALYMKESVASTQSLAEKGKALSGKVQSDFTGLEATKAPGIATALGTSVNNLAQAASTAPEVVKQLARLAEGLKSL